MTETATMMMMMKEWSWIKRALSYKRRELVKSVDESRVARTKYDTTSVVMGTGSANAILYTFRTCLWSVCLEQCASILIYWSLVGMSTGSDWYPMSCKDNVG
jgi:hypothetical protein